MDAAISTSGSIHIIYKKENHMMFYTVTTHQCTRLPPHHHNFCCHTKKHQFCLLITLTLIINPSLEK